MLAPDEMATIPSAGVVSSNSHGIENSAKRPTGRREASYVRANTTPNAGIVYRKHACQLVSRPGHVPGGQDSIP